MADWHTSPAFPCEVTETSADGLTKREAVAAQILAALVASGSYPAVSGSVDLAAKQSRHLAQIAVEMADDLEDALEEPRLEDAEEETET